MRKRTSSGVRRQFSVENAYADTVDDADLHGAVEDVHERGLTGAVTLGAGQAAGLGPAPVAVHDDRDVRGARARRERRGARHRCGCGGGSGHARRAGSRLATWIDGLARAYGSEAAPRRAVRARARRTAATAGPAPGATAGAPRSVRWTRAGWWCRSRRRSAQSPPSSATMRPIAAGAGPRRARRAAVRADGPAGGDVEGRVRPGRGAHRALGERGLPPGPAHGPDEEGVEHQARRVLALAQHPQRADGEQVEPQRGLALLGEPLGRLAGSPRRSSSGCSRWRAGRRRRAATRPA